jgi:hypothetical protein
MIGCDAPALRADELRALIEAGGYAPFAGGA